MPTRTSSAFLEKGVLTPEEFVAAGDELVFKCPTWSWEAGDPDKARSFLPKGTFFFYLFLIVMFLFAKGEVLYTHCS